jgi:hypothetical protein
MIEVARTGVGLEARIQRLFMAQGVFAERHLFPSASADHRMLATDVDVLISEYASGFHVTRRHVECKGGRIKLLDRILWLSGVRKLLHADTSYLVVSDFDTAASEFARSLDIQLLNIKQLEGWEAAIPVPQDLWPCRSEYQSYDKAKAVWARLISSKQTDAGWQLLREILGFIEIDSWLSFHYGQLNKLLRLIKELSRAYDDIRRDAHGKLFARYLFSALLVRLCQYLLAVCQDAMRLPATDVRNYLDQRLTYGDQDPKYISGLIDGTVKWVKQALDKEGKILPPEIDVGRLYEVPPYAAEFFELTNRLLQQSNDARYLTIAMETSQFGIPDVTTKFPRLQVAAMAGDSLAAVVKGFVLRTFSVPGSLAMPVSSDLRATYRTVTVPFKKPKRNNQAQLPL